MAWYFVNILGKAICGLYGTVSGNQKYNEFKKKETKGIIIFSHPTFYDFVPMIHALGEVPQGVIKSKYMIEPLKIFAKRLKMILVQEKKSGVSETITNIVNNRKQGEDLICICLAGTTSKNQDEIPEYKTGAFLTLPPILPIVMYYSDITIWDKQSLFEIVYKRITGPIISYSAIVMDPIYPEKDETIPLYIERVRRKMKEGIAECKSTVPSFRGFKQCFEENKIIMSIFSGMIFGSLILQGKLFYASIMSLLFILNYFKESRQYALFTFLIWLYIGILEPLYYREFF